MNCTRRPGSVWTMCHCDQCRTLSARNAKLFRNGRLPTVDRRVEAVRRLETWTARGYSPTAIAGMTGLADRTIQALMAGRTSPARMLHRTARLILDAPDTPTGGGWVPAAGSVRRLRALTVMGWSMDHLADRYSVNTSTLSTIRTGKHAQTRPVFATAIAAMYDELWNVPGPGRLAGTRARNRGWYGPLAWDDDTIDDPTAEPHSETRKDRSSLDTALDVEDLLEMGPFLTADELGRRLGYSDRGGIQQALKRTGRRDLLDRLARNAYVAANTRRTA